MPRGASSRAMSVPLGLHNCRVRVTILGFGLIGGSVARALRQRDTEATEPWRIAAWSRTPAPVEQAVRDGVVDVSAETLEAALDGADLVLLAAPPLASLDLLDRIGGPLRNAVGDATVTDAVSVKAEVLAQANRLRLHFVGGHPMAGRELSGYAAALPDLYAGRPWVTVPGTEARPIDVERVQRLIAGCGAVEVSTTAEAHDAAVAAISHMPLVVSAALVEAVAGRPGEPPRLDWPLAQKLAATGWASMTRLARGEPGMGAGIAVTNAAAIAEQLREMRAVLDEWIAELEAADGPDANRLRDHFAAARLRLEQE
jgi:prephenate dehydrogenase